jgi:uracil DNA glycosylase
MERSWVEKMQKGEKTEEIIADFEKQFASFLEEKDYRIKAFILGDIAFQIQQAINLKFPKPLTQDIIESLRNIVARYNEEYEQLTSEENVTKIPDFEVKALRHWHNVLLNTLQVQPLQELPQ